MSSPVVYGLSSPAPQEAQQYTYDAGIEYAHVPVFGVAMGSRNESAGPIPAVSARADLPRSRKSQLWLGYCPGYASRTTTRYWHSCSLAGGAYHHSPCQSLSAFGTIPHREGQSGLSARPQSSVPAFRPQRMLMSVAARLVSYPWRFSCSVAGSQSGTLDDVRWLRRCLIILVDGEAARIRVRKAVER